MKRLIVTAIMAIVLAAAPANPVSWAFSSASPVSVKAGGKFTVKFVARIEDGWHLYGMKPLPDGPIPTRIWIPEGQPFALAAPIGAAQPRILHDPSFGMDVEIYEREAVFTLPVRVADMTPIGPIKIAVNVSYQTCDNTICLPPKTVTVELPVTVSK